MLVHDFHELRTKVKKMGLLKSSVPFFAFMFLHAFLLDMASWFTIWYFGKSWVPFLIGVAMFTVAQVTLRVAEYSRVVEPSLAYLIK